MSNDQHFHNGPSSSRSNNSNTYSCEICGDFGFTDEKMLEHTQKCHVENQSKCPFCGLVESSDELLLHVNQAHLDYLTPENPDNELMSYIDDSKTPSGDESSESMSCSGLSPTFAENGQSENINNLSNGSTRKTIILESKSTSKCKTIVKEFINNANVLVNRNSEVERCEPEIFKYDNNNVMDDNNNANNNICDIDANGASGADSKIENHGEGSPLRSQLGLKLKANKPKITVPSIHSPLICLLCPYATNDPNTLEEHINRSHFDPISPGINNSNNSTGSATTNHIHTTEIFSCPLCISCFHNSNALELHVNHEHSDILSPAKADSSSSITLDGEASSFEVNSKIKEDQDEAACNNCPVCGISFIHMKTQEMELHIEAHFAKSPTKTSTSSPDLEKEARKAQEQREFEMLRAQYGMDNQGNFREQSAVAMQRAVYAGEMSVADYYCRQVNIRAAESNGVDDSSSCTKSVIPRVTNFSSMSSQGIIKSYVCSNIDHYAASYGDRGWGCGYRNAQMIISSLFQNPNYNDLLRTAIGSNSMPSISKLQKMIEEAWSQGFDEQGKEQLGCKLFETRKWIGATEIVTLFSWMRLECQLVDFHCPTASNGSHPELFNYVLHYFEQPKSHTPPLYLQHQGHSRTIIGIEQKSSGFNLLILDPSHSPKQMASVGTSQDSLRLLRRGQSAMKAPQYQIVTFVGKIATEEDYQASKIIRSLRIPHDR